jgi:hypothetical protein
VEDPLVLGRFPPFLESVSGPQICEFVAMLQEEEPLQCAETTVLDLELELMWSE